MRVRSLSVEERPSEFLLQLPDRPRQGGLGYMAALGRLSKVQLLAQGEEIPHLMHLHGIPPAILVFMTSRGLIFFLLNSASYDARSVEYADSGTESMSSRRPRELSKGTRFVGWGLLQALSDDRQTRRW